MFLSLLHSPQKVDGRYKILQRGLTLVLLDTAQEKSKRFVTITPKEDAVRLNLV